VPQQKRICDRSLKLVRKKLKTRVVYTQNFEKLIPVQYVIVLIISCATTRTMPHPKAKRKLSG
jgi:hypothetical protein